MVFLESYIYGRNVVREALQAQVPIKKIMLAKGISPQVEQEILALARAIKVPVQQIDRKYIEELAPNKVHQGVLAYVAERHYVSVEDLLAASGPPLIVVLNEIQDPQNLGAILRTAEAAGCRGLVIPNRRAAGITAAVVKSSAGAANHLPVARVTNIADTLRFFKKHSWWVAGADPKGEQTYWQLDFTGPLVLVIGGESKGLGRSVRKECDFLARIPLAGRVKSLNASVATALLLYEVVRQRELPAP